MVSRSLFGSFLKWFFAKIINIELFLEEQRHPPVSVIQTSMSKMFKEQIFTSGCHRIIGSKMALSKIPIKTSLCGEYYLLTVEALHIRELKPQINTKNEYKSRELMIKL